MSADPATPHHRAGRRVVIVALLLIAAQLVWRGWIAYHSWWLGDDFIVIDAVSAPEGHDLAGLVNGYEGHLLPARLYLAWLMVRTAPYDYDLAAASMIAVQTLAALGMLRFLVVAFGRRWAILVPLALYLGSAFAVQASVWWVVSMGLFTTLAALAWSMSAQLSYLRTGNRRSAVVAALWVVFGLAFSERALLVIGALAFLTLAYFAEGSWRDRLRQVWHRYRISVMLLFLLGVAYLALYVAFTLNFSPGKAGSTPIGPVLENMVLRAWAPGAFGGPLVWGGDQSSATPLSAAPTLFIVICLVLLGLLIREFSRSRTHSLRALLLPAFFLSCDVLLVVAARAALVGPGIGLEYRYIQELAMVTPMALALAVLSIRGAAETVEVTRRSPFLDRPLVVGVACFAIIALGVHSTMAYVDHWNGGRAQAEQWMKNLLTSAKELPEGAQVVDGPAPSYVAWPIAHPANMASHLVRPLDTGLRFSSVGDESLRAVQKGGAIGPATITTMRRAAVRGPRSCRNEVTDRPRILRLDGPVVFGDTWVRVGYIATGNGAIEVTAGGATRSTSIRQGLHYLYFKAGDDRYDSVTLGPITGPAVLCTADVVVGHPKAKETK